MISYRLLNPETDTLSPVSTIAKARTGKRPSPATICRWVRKGVKGVRLEAIQHSGCWHTTTVAFGDFLRRQTERALDPRPPDVNQVNDESLRKAGLL